MISINIKPLSVNQAWQGRRFKTQKYKSYERELLYKLPNLTIPKDKLKLTIYFHLSNSNNDIDNSIKPFIDVLQKKYGFNDNKVYELSIHKIIVDKKSERITFNIESIIV